MPSDRFPLDVVVVGGCGHVGLPLGIAFASRGKNVALYDINDASVKLVNEGDLPFHAEGAEQPLRAALAAVRLVATTDAGVISRAANVVVVVGTPVDEHLSPDPQAIPRALRAIGEHFRNGQLLILR